MTDVDVEFSSTAGFGASPVRAGDLLPHSVESYLSSFRSPCIRPLIEAVTRELASDQGAAKHSRTENGFVVAKRLKELAQQIATIGDAVREKSAQTSTSIQTRRQ